MNKKLIVVIATIFLSTLYLYPMNHVKRHLTRKGTKTLLNGKRELSTVTDVVLKHSMSKLQNNPVVMDESNKARYLGKVLTTKMATIEENCQHLVGHTLPKDKVEEIVIRSYEREQRYNDKGYVVAYTACHPRIADAQDFYTALYQKKVLKKSKVELLEPNNTEPGYLFLRNPKLSIQSTAPDIINKCQFGNYTDHTPEINFQVISASLSMLDEGCERGESALCFLLVGGSDSYYYTKDSDYKALAAKIGKKVYKNWTADQYYILPEMHTGGQLLQIFIPNHSVEKIVYPSKPFGEFYKTADQNDANLLGLLANIRSGKFDLSKNHIPQLRIVLNSNYFANPESGILMHRYTTASAEEIADTIKKRDKFYMSIEL